VRGNLKNIILGFFVAIYFIVAFLEHGSGVNAAPTSKSSDNICYFEQAAKTDDVSAKTIIIKKKSRPSVLKIKMQVGAIILLHKLPHTEQIAFHQSSDAHQFISQISYVPYLPRDPPRA
jgi:hypothetical protein